MSFMEVIMKMTTIFSTDKTENAAPACADGVWPAAEYRSAAAGQTPAQGRFLIEGSLRQGRANTTDTYLVTQAFMD